MKILSVNAGSSSFKFSLFNMDTSALLTNGVFERIGLNESFVRFEFNGEKIKKDCELKTHTDAVKILIDLLIEYKIINSLNEIEAVGHRIVHGGDMYSSSVLLTDGVIKQIEELSSLAPLHNPANIMGIKGFKEVLDVPMVGVFDTAFHQTKDKEE